MPPLRQSVPAAPVAAFARLRAELDLPGPFPPAVLAAAEAAVARGPLTDPHRVDATSLPLLTVDPPGSRDLDQALHVEHRPGQRLRAWYAIADVAAFVRVGDAIDLEARDRGRTVYLPDGSVPLHPRVLSEGAASLLPGHDRPAMLWRVDLDADGAVEDADLCRATVRSREQLDYREAQLRTARPGSSLAALLELGRRRQQQEWERGGIALGLPDQRVELVDGVPQLHLRSSLPIEEANAQLSLLVGTVAARTMVDAGVGILRTLPPPAAEDVAALRADAQALGAPWPAGIDHATFLRTLHASTPRDAALLVVAARSLRGAGYLVLGPGIEPVSHGAVAAFYAHVTAPLRRLVDRYAHEALLAVTDGRELPEDVAAAMATIPRAMASGGGRAASAEKATTDLAEALLLSDRAGSVLRAVPIRHRGDTTDVRIVEPPVMAHVPGNLPLGMDVEVRVDAVDIEARTITLTPNPSPTPP